MDLDSSVEKLEEGVAKAKVALTQAQAAADKYQVTQKHWDKVSDAESKFNSLLERTNRIFAEKNVGKGKKLMAKVNLLAIAGLIFLLGSTIALMLWAGKKQKSSRTEE